MKNPRKPLVYKGFRGRSEEARTPDILLPKKSGVPVSAHFQPFPPLSARKHILSGTLTSTVSVCSGRVCGINCGQEKHPECSFRRIRGVFCRLYGNSCSAKSQGLCRTNFAPQQTKKKGFCVLFYHLIKGQKSDSFSTSSSGNWLYTLLTDSKYKTNERLLISLFRFFSSIYSSLIISQPFG